MIPNKRSLQNSVEPVIFCAPLVSKTTSGVSHGRPSDAQMTCEQMKCERWLDGRENSQSEGFITRIENKCIKFKPVKKLSLTSERIKNIALFNEFCFEICVDNKITLSEVFRSLLKI